MGPTGGGEEKVRTASPFVGKLSPVAEARRPSRLRSLAPALAVEGMIWLAGGLPPRDVFPLTSVTLTTKYGDVVTVDDPQQVAPGRV